MIQDIFDTGKGIFELSPTLCAKSEAQRHRLASLLELIGHMVRDTAAHLRRGHLPASKSQQLALLSEELYFRLAFSVGEIKARTLSTKLKNGYASGHLQSELHASEAAHQHLGKLEDAAAYFLVTSANLRTPA